jgi:hypothetical protein
MVYNLASNKMARQAVHRLMQMNYARKAMRIFLPIVTN